MTHLSEIMAKGHYASACVAPIAIYAGLIQELDTLYGSRKFSMRVPLTGCHSLPTEVRRF